MVLVGIGEIGGYRIRLFAVVVVKEVNEADSFAMFNVGLVLALKLDEEVVR